MTTILLDFSQRPELSLYASVVADVEAVADEFRHWTEEDAFQYELAGARMLGLDVSALLDDSGIDRVAGVLLKQVDAANPGPLPGEMNAYEPDSARALLEAMLSGILENRHK